MEKETKENVLETSKTVDLMELFPKILNVDKKTFKITPSEYIKEMSMTMEERHKKLVHIANTMKTTNDSYPPQFKVIPNILIFQKFEPRSSNSLNLTIVNVGKSLLPVKMYCPSSVYFSANFAGSPTTKLAPGLSVEYEITFAAEETKDYFHHLVFTSKEKTFQVPIIAIGLRPMLDIPDQIILNPSPVKITTNKFIMVRNIGNAPAVFNFISQSDYFRVTPAKGILSAHESMLLSILFESSKVKEVSESLFLMLETGEKLSITLHGSAENVSVRLDKNSVVHEDTFIGLKRCKTVHLINNSSSVIKFSWKKNKTQEEDSIIIDTMKDKYKEIMELEILKDTKVIYYGLSDAQKHRVSCERILKDELRLLEREEFSFTHESFSIMPQSGEVWPKGTVEIIIAFEPKTCGPVFAEAYLEVSGKDSRLPLKIRANGMGPNITLNMRTLDINYVYLCSLHRYEITAENKGDIPGTIEYVAEPLVFGGKAELTPELRHLKPGELGSFVISFTSNRQGDFTEKLFFVIKESKEKICLVLKGRVISPTLHFDIKHLNFGIVPLGFPKKNEVTLSNLSVVPVTFTLRVSPDGEQPSISYEEFARYSIKPALPLCPKEFKVYPEESVVEPLSSKKVTVTLTANRVGNFKKKLVVDMWDSETGSVSCPITYRAFVPTFLAHPENMAFPFCFLNFPYSRSMTLRNSSKVAGFFYIVPTDPSEVTPMTCSPSIPQGVIQPHSSIDIDLTLMTSALGRHVFSLFMLTFGFDHPREICTISFIGQGPVVTVKPNNLNWGDLPLLETVNKTLDIANESPIPATLTLSTSRTNSPWSASPSTIIMEPERSTKVVVSLTLNERGKFKDVLKVNVYNGKDLQVPLTATGLGSCLIINPNISPSYYLGTLFCQKKYEYAIFIQNKGMKPYSLIWSPFVDYKLFANMKFVMPSDSVFKFEPTKIDIMPGDNATVILKANSFVIGTFMETFYCFATIGGPTKELLLTTEVRADFVTPKVNFDKNEINFWNNIGFDENDDKLIDTVRVTNMAVLPISMEASTTHPFCLAKYETFTQTVHLSLEGLESTELRVKFISHPNANKNSRIFKGKLSLRYKEYNTTSSINLTGEVNYPNVYIQPVKVDFGHVLVGMSFCKDINLTNISPLTVHYDISWNAGTSELIQFESTCSAKRVSLDHNASELSGESEFGETLREELRKTEQVPSTEKNPVDVAQTCVPPSLPKMPEIEISSSDIQAALFPLTRNYYTCDSDLMDAYKMARSSDTENIETMMNVTDLCDITPFYGKLEPYSSQVLTIQFYSSTPVKAYMEALVNIKSGPTEVIRIDAVSAEINYQLSKTELDFGKQLFCETKSQTLIVKNMAAMPFSYEAMSQDEEVCDMSENFPLGKGVLTVSPSSGMVKSYEQAELIVRYHPGVPGQFENIFFLQVAHFEPIPIKVKGVGVFPQVYIHLPRPDILNVAPEVGYLAVASITPDWILAGIDMRDVCSLKPYRSRDSNWDSLLKADSKEDEWEFVDFFEFVPSEIDMYLAVERILAYGLISEDSTNNAAFAIYARTIPRFSVPAYLLDFGICVIGQITEQQMSLTNFGPLPAIIYGIFDSKIKEEGIHVRLKNRNELKIGASLPFTIAFHPKKSKFRHKFEKLESEFYFEIYHGPKIPIKILAHVTYPHVIASMNLLNFSSVMCGCCKVINLRLMNPGLVPAQWSANRKEISDNYLIQKQPVDVKEEEYMFHYSCTSGELNPGQYCTLQVTFKPEFGGTFSSTLHIDVVKGLSSLKILMMGNAIEPKLNISHKILNFKATVPFPHKKEKIFSVENPCPFPVEYYFPYFDDQVYEEDKIIRAVTLYYGTESLLLPVRQLGGGLPPEIVDFYHMLLEGLNAKFMEEERNKMIAEREKDSLEENVSSVFSVEEDSLLGSSQASFHKKKKNRKTSRSRTSLETSREFVSNGRELNVPTIFEKKQSHEIEKMLEGYIKSIKDTNPGYDPVQAALKSTVPPVKEEKYRDGTLIVFHGAPFTDSVQLANRAAVYMNMFAQNIDRIVLEEAALGRCDAGILAKELIEQAHFECLGAEDKKNETELSVWEESESEKSVQSDYETTFDEIQRKFNALVDMRDSFISARKISASAKSDTSRKMDKAGTPAKSQVNSKAPIAKISEDIVEDILRYRFALEAAEGIIIEGLQSALITSATKALLLLLKAVGNIQNIIVIFFLKNYAQHTEYRSNIQKEQELADLYLREEMLRILEEEPEEVFQSLNLDPDVGAVLREVFLAHRHESHAGFEKKKERFYETQRQIRQALKQGLLWSLPIVNLEIEPESFRDKKVKESGRKKEGRKGSKTSVVSNRKSENEMKSARFKRDSFEAEFLSFETDFMEMKGIVENWDQRLGALVMDAVPEVKHKKGQTPRKVDLALPSKLNTERGVFLWLVDVSNPQHNSFPACCSYLKSALLDRPIPQESDNWPLESEDSMTFSVVTSPPKRKKDPVQHVFSISAAENFVIMAEDAFEDLGEFVSSAATVNSKLNRSVSSISFQSKRKDSSTSKKRKIDSRMSTDKSIRSKKAFSSALAEEIRLKPRWILQPGETQSYCVKFFPVEPGKYEKVYALNIVTWHNDDSVNCKGLCDIPRLNMRPEVLFPAVEQCKPLNRICSAAYYYADNAYDFGSVITATSSEGRKCVEKSVFFNACNISSLPVDLLVTLTEHGMVEVSGLQPIRVKPDRVWLRPGETKRLAVTASAQESGPFEQTLYFVIKDNPKVESIKVTFEGVKANVTVSPTTVNFDRILLHRKESRFVVFTNNNAVPLFLTMKGHENFPSQFSFSETSGWIQPMRTLITEIQYNATEVQIINEKLILVQVYDCPESAEPVQEFTFDVNAEAYDVALDVTFSKPEEDHIDFGDIRVENTYSIEFNMKNVGKYLIGYKVEINWELLVNSGNEQFYIQPSEGTLHPGKLFPITVCFQAQNEITWKKIDLFKIMLVEPFCADELIATIPIGVSARSHFSKYELCPSDLFNFGHVRVGSITTRPLVIVNKGHFSFSYFIEPHSSVRLPEPGNETTKKSSKHSVSSKEKPDKGKKNSVSVLRAGNFEISPSSGTVETGQTAIVNVTCCPDKVKTFEEIVVVFVNESVPTLKKGNQMTFIVEGCLPVIRFDDHKTLFREHLLCKEETEVRSRIQLGSHTVYIEKDNLFLFKNICVNKPAEARIHLQNDGLVESHVIAYVEPQAEEGSRGAISAEVYFSVSPEKLIIEPYSLGCLVLTFRPDALEVYKGKLTITLEMPEALDDVVKVVDLWGNGILPHIEITEPNTKLPEGQTLVNFPAVSPGHRSTSSIAFSNIGMLSCKVIIELYKSQNSVFTLTPKPNTEKMLKIWELTKPIDHTAIVSLCPGEVAEFQVAFNPQELQTYSSQIKLLVVDNPFENWCYRLIGEVFFEEVIIEKIRTAIPFLAEDSGDSRNSAPIGPGHYSINFGECHMKKKSKVLLRLANKTEKDFFRFEWDEIQSISAFPAIGHLFPKSYKEILIVFSPDEPMELEDVTISCLLNKILFRSPPELSWDSRLVHNETHTNASPSSSHLNPTPIQVVSEEPEHEVVPESTRMLYVDVSGIVDYSRLMCDVTKIVFKNTFMFQTRVYPLVLENPGNVSAEYKLTLKTVTVWPLKDSKMSQAMKTPLLNACPTNNRPQSSVHVASSRRQRPCGKNPRPLTSIPLLDLNESSSNHVSEEQLSASIGHDGSSLTYNPFTIENATGRIKAKEKTSCKILFSPMDTNVYKAVLKIQVANLHPECSLPDIEVTASSVMPYCHFVVPESDYLESGRRDYSRPGPIGYAPGVPLHPDTKTIETKVLGVGFTTPIKFHVINPTEEEYTFSWSNVTQSQPGVVPSFHCSTVDGRIRAGRQQLMVFSFVSQKLGITESFWKFSVPKFGVETLFLFVGDVREPAVYFLSNHVYLMPTLIGSSSSDVVTLANHEDIPFEFYFLPESLYSEGRLNFLKVEPPSGKILPHSELSFRLIFTGKTAGKTLFNVKCKVKSIKEPFAISVETTTYGVQPLVVFEDLNKVKHHPEVNKENVIDFGSALSPNRPETITITLTSLSKTSFYYEWEYNQRLLEVRHCKLKFSVRNGHVASFSTGKCDVTIVFFKKSSLMNFPLKLKIRRGPTFTFLIKGSASTPLYEFSFHCYDFGFCFLQQKDICYHETVLVIRNKDSVNLFLECALSSLSVFSYCLPESIIPIGGELTVSILFHPKDCIPYKDELKFTINGLHEKVVLLKGHGTDFKVTLADAEDTTISLGAIKAGKTSSKKFSLMNKGLGTAVLVVGFSDQLPVSGLHLAKPKENPLDLSQNHRLTGLITISPSTVFRVKPQETFTLTVMYSPQHRCPPFSETVYLQHQETAEPLCLLTGCCLEPEISLDRNFINFGAVVETCRTTLRLKLINSGSFGARFEWDTENLSEHLISPAWGYCSPESDVTINVTFCPTTVQNCIRKLVECKLYLSENETYPSLRLEMVGDCIACPEPTETITFECFVRQTDSKILKIENPSGQEWQLLPVISGEYFKGPDTLIVNPLSSADYQVEYCPLVMTEKEGFHEGSVFFRLPKGQVELYCLKGVSKPPVAEDVIEREVPCKTKYVELLKVKNWLQYPQRFKITVTGVDCQDNPVYTCNGLEYLEVPALTQKEYSLNFFAYNVGYLRFHVSFENEETSEYAWYDVGFYVYMCGPLEVITLKSGVRQTSHHELKLDNPLNETIHYELKTTSPEVYFENSVWEVPPEEAVYVTIYFTPIHPGEKTEKLTATCAQLGVFPRQLRLIGVELQPEAPRRFETLLGTSQIQEFLVTNFSHVNAVLFCKVDSDEFSVNEQSNVAAGQSTQIKVVYEPSELGSITATLNIQSEQAGNFIFPLVGICEKPLAKGPFTLKTGSGVFVPFKNVFKTAKEFHMYVDSPAFELKSTQETLMPKEESKIFVGMQKTKNLEKLPEYKEMDIKRKFPVMGQLVVECFNPYVKWQFYLKGIFEN